MNTDILDDYAFKINQLKTQHNLRQLHHIHHDGRYIKHPQISTPMLNLASNDYLGLSSNQLLKEEFLSHHASHHLFSSSSSRLLTGHFDIYAQLEHKLALLFGRSALLFNSGYHMNIGILPALCDKKTIILADKLIHASLIDGILLSKATFKRYRHQDLHQLENYIADYQENHHYQKIIIVTESLFSMDGDITNLSALVALKEKYPKVMLYVDEAHALGVMGKQGLGCAEHFAVIDKIDILVGTFGKALASVGGYVICHKIIKQYLINTMRPLIFSTALPPINIAWSYFMLHKVLDSHRERQVLLNYHQKLIEAITKLNLDCPSQSQIVPIILGDNKRTLNYAHHLQQAGFYVMAVRPPTVPQGQARLRICLNSAVLPCEFEQLINTLKKILKEDNCHAD